MTIDVVLVSLLFTLKIFLQKIFCKKPAFKNLEKRTGKYLCQSLFLDNVSDCLCLCVKSAFLPEDCLKVICKKSLAALLLPSLFWEAC